MNQGKDDFSHLENSLPFHPHQWAPSLTTQERVLHLYNTSHQSTQSNPLSFPSTCLDLRPAVLYQGCWPGAKFGPGSVTA